MLSSDLQSADKLGIAVAEETHMLKGIGEQKISYFDQFKETPSDNTQIAMFISNSEITAQLQQLLTGWNSERFWALYEALKGITLHSKDPEHGRLIIEHMKKAKARVFEERVMASLIMLVPRLTKKEFLSKESALFLKEFLLSENLRISANTLEALGEIGLFDKSAKSFFKSEDNRTRANAILVFGKNEIDSEISKHLNEMLISENSLNVASGLYATEKLFGYYLEQDLTFFKTADFFRNIFVRVDALRAHSSTSINNKANIIYSDYSPYFS
jgi:hypothetical protein